MTVGSNTGVVLPTPVFPSTVSIYNAGANALSIYPQSGGKINNGPANASVSLAAGASVSYWASAPPTGTRSRAQAPRARRVVRPDSVQQRGVVRRLHADVADRLGDRRRRGTSFIAARRPGRSWHRARAANSSRRRALRQIRSGRAATSSGTVTSVSWTGDGTIYRLG